MSISIGDHFPDSEFLSKVCFPCGRDESLKPIGYVSLLTQSNALRVCFLLIIQSFKRNVIEVVQINHPFGGTCRLLCTTRQSDHSCGLPTLCRRATSVYCFGPSSLTLHQMGSAIDFPLMHRAIHAAFSSKSLAPVSCQTSALALSSNVSLPLAHVPRTVICKTCSFPHVARLAQRLNIVDVVLSAILNRLDVVRL
jgi:hypothetical protein